MMEQAQKLSLCSNAIQHDQVIPFAEKITSVFRYECVIPMNTGTEACETALKYARRWGYEKKGVPANEAKVIVPSGTYSGHSLAALSASSDSELRKGFGPFLPGFFRIPYGDLPALEEALNDPDVVAFLLEPILGESGVIIPPPDYLRNAARLCRQKNVLLIADEIQTGLGRTGKITACEHEGIRPDLLVLGKALSGGMLPVSAVLCDTAVAEVVGPEEHNSTFAMNPIACRVATAAIDVMLREKLADAARDRGEIFRREVSGWKFPWVKDVRGKGLLNCVELQADAPILISTLSRALEEKGIIALPISKKIMRFSPPLVIGESEMQESLEKIHSAFRQFSES